MKTLVLFLGFLTAGFSQIASNYVSLFDLSGTTQTIPVTISRVFAKGELLHYPRPRIDGTPLSTWQADNKNTWNDTSVRHSLISFPVTIPANSFVVVDFVDSLTPNSGGSPLTQAEMLAFNSAAWNVGATLTNSGIPQVTNARTILQDDVTAGKTCGAAGSRCKYWLQGPVVTQAIVRAPLDDPTNAFQYDMGWGTACSGAPCKPITPQYVLTFYAGWPGVQEEIVLENVWTTKFEEWTYDVLIKSGPSLATTQYSKAARYHYPASRDRKVFWDGTAVPAIKRDLNREYIIRSKAVLNYDTSIGNVTAGAIAKEISDWNLSDHGVDMGTSYVAGGNVWHADWRMDFTGTGERPEIGPLTSAQGKYLFSWDTGLESMVRGMADATGHWPMWARESRNSGLYCAFSCTGGNATLSAFGRLISLDNRPTSFFNRYGTSWEFHNSGTIAADDITPIAFTNPGVAGGWHLDNAHDGDAGYFPYLIWGDYFYYEALMMKPHYFLMGFNPSTTGGTSKHKWWGVGFPQVRGNAWTTRNMGNAIFMALDGSAEKEYLTSKIENNAAVNEGFFNVQNGNYGPRGGDFTCPTTGVNAFNPNSMALEDRWCWGRVYKSTMAHNIKNLPNPLQMGMVTGDSPVEPFLSQTLDFMTDSWQEFFWTISMGANSDRDIKQQDFVMKALATGELREFFDPASNPFLGAMYNSPGTIGPTGNGANGTYPDAYVAPAGYPLTAPQWASLFVVGFNPDPVHCSAISLAATTWICPATAANGNPLLAPDKGYSLHYRAAVSFWPALGISATSSTGSTLTAAAAWAWIAADPMLNALSYNLDPKWRILPRNLVAPVTVLGKRVSGSTNLSGSGSIR